MILCIDAEETSTPAQIDEDHTPTSVILRNHDNAVATLKDSAAGLSPLAGYTR